MLTQENHSRAFFFKFRSAVFYIYPNEVMKENSSLNLKTKAKDLAEYTEYSGNSTQICDLLIV